MIAASLRVITSRKGSFLGGSAVVLAGALVVLVVLVTVHVLRPGRNPSIGGANMVDGTYGVVFVLGVVVAIVMGALAGSYDVAQGTMRYLLMTGARRGQIYAARSIALAVAVLLAIAPALAFGTLAALVLPHVAEDRVVWGIVGDAWWTCALYALVFALISMGIGSLLRSNGAAIAISLVVLFGLTPLLLLLDGLSPTLGDLMLLNALDRITGADEGAPIAVAALAVVAWVALFWSAGRLRVQRDEY